MWDRLRNTKDAMHHIYSFLSVYDRVHVAELDKTFRDDEARGRGSRRKLRRRGTGSTQGIRDDQEMARLRNVVSKVSGG
jgi:hypothetical protein